MSENKIYFKFDEKTYGGIEGDTIASALLRNEVKLVGRSFKYHRPRGIYTCGIEEPNALVQILNEHNEPNVRATVKKIYDGMVVKSQNRWPSLKRDLGSINNLLSPIFSAGFYYKTFMGPKGFWKNVYEPLIRRTAGLGKPPKEFKSKSIHLHHNVDVLIVGGGLAGLLAAKKLAGTNQDVLLVERDSNLGGIIGNSNKIKSLDGQKSEDWIEKTEWLLKSANNIKILKNTTVTTYNYKDHLVAIEDRSVGTPPDNNKPELIMHKIRTKNTVLANGHIERFLSFRNNDLPGVMLAASFEKYIHRYGVVADKSPVIFTNNSSTFSLIKTLVEMGHKPKAYVDIRDAKKIEKETLDLIINHNIPFYPKSEIEGCEGKNEIKDTFIRTKKDKTVKIKTSMLCVSGGLNPDIHLFTQSKGLVKWDEKILTFKPEKSFQNTITLGSASGNFHFNKLVDEVNKKLNFIEGSNIIKLEFENSGPKEFNIKEIWETKNLKKSLWSKSFIDLQNDVTTKDLRQAIREGFDRIEHLKRFTTNSMGTDQGKISSINALGIASKILKKSVSDVGTTTYRPPYSPVSFSAIAGRSTYEFYDPERKTPIHPWHEKHNAVFEDVGQWKRPWYFKKYENESMHDAVQRESKQVRESAGILDGSTLGKIEIKGRDALQFINLMYTNSFTKMKPMSGRYGLMLGEDGMVKDDGIVCKINDQHFIATTTTGGAANVLSHMEEYAQTEWPHMNVYMNSITEQFSTFNLSGPKSRIIIQRVFSNVDFSNENFPFMSFKYINYLDAKIRILRASFTGELGYEIYVPPKYALKLWERIFYFSRDVELVPYGTESMHLLRAEKGYIIVGQDTDGTVTPIDLNLNWMIGKKKNDFIGKRSLSRSDIIKSDRKQLVGLVPINKAYGIEEGQHVIEEENLSTPIKEPVKMLGQITSSYFSPTLNHCVALALIKEGNRKFGSQLFVSTSNLNTIAVEVVKPNFIDPKNERLTS